MEVSLNKLREIALALDFQNQKVMNMCFNPDFPDMKPTPIQQEILEDWSETRCKIVLGGERSGKSQLGARTVSWFYLGIHPYYPRPPEWGSGPITIIVAGRKGEQIDSELWGNKLKRYISEDRYREKRVGQMLQSVTDPVTGNKIIFQSHNKAEQAAIDIQSHTSHIVWLDEMPTSAKLVTQLRTRVQNNKGIFIATFTPLIRNVEVKELIDGIESSGSGKLYRIKKLDNPMFAGREAEILAEYVGVGESEKQARLNGEWFMGEKSVFSLDGVVEAPVGLNSQWRHMEMSDPAASGKFGFLLAAEDPRTNIWYVVRSEYIPGDAPSSLAKYIADETRYINMIKRVADTASDWYIKEARKPPNCLQYVGPEKANRHTEMITQAKQVFSDGRWKVAPWCDELLKEMSLAQWSDAKEDTIVNSKKYHCLHALFYGVDLVPPPVVVRVRPKFEEWLVAEDNKRRANEYAALQKAAAHRHRHAPRRRRSRWGR